MFHKKLNLVQYKVLTDKYWELHWQFQTKSSLVLMKDQGWFYQVDNLGVNLVVKLASAEPGEGDTLGNS